ncbi:expressed unknown protein [Seminavis robusta]|uniref:Uncharacterized protein n=1 Tax=Seminavis robusta TaxID=568900 RepID=A0A9N8HLD5_9STRA|nr:expressed unknown protein [Seminavis robusta]|eukprot:Sro907_g218751.1  (107) ;mRNA; f:20510-20830
MGVGKKHRYMYCERAAKGQRDRSGRFYAVDTLLYEVLDRTHCSQDPDKFSFLDHLYVDGGNDTPAEIMAAQRTRPRTNRQSNNDSNNDGSHTRQRQRGTAKSKRIS